MIILFIIALYYFFSIYDRNFRKIIYYTELNLSDIKALMALQNVKDIIKFKCTEDESIQNKFELVCTDIEQSYYSKTGYVVYNMYLEPDESGTFIYLYLMKRTFLNAQLKYGGFIMDKFMKQKLQARIIERGWKDEKEVIMLKRIVALCVDCMVLFFAAICYCILFVPIMILVFNATARMFLISFGISIGILFWIYQFVCDYWGKGRTLGKRLLGIKINCAKGSISPRLAIIHSLIKLIALFIYPITFLYFLIKKQMIYDNKLQINIIEEQQK